MRKVTVTLSTGVKETIEVPLSMYDMTTGTYERVIQEWDGTYEPKSLIKLFALVTGKNFTDYEASTDFKLEKTLITCLQFLFNGSVVLNELERPKFLLNVIVPEKLGRMTLGQNLHVRKVVAGAKDIRMHVSFACAVYLQPLIDGGSFDDSRIEAIQEDLRKLPITTVYPVGFFFLGLLSNSGTWRTKVLVLISRIIASKPNSARWFQRLVSQNFWTTK